MSPPNANHYSLVAERLADGKVVPFLGAGANLCDRPLGTPWGSGTFLPSGVELARALAQNSQYPQLEAADLSRVSQYVDAVLGEGDLYSFLRTVFDADYPPSSLHRLLAEVPPRLHARGRPQLLVLTTNYDDLVERAFTEADVEYDVVWYEAKRGPMLGRFFHRSPDGTVEAIEKPNKYTRLSLTERPAILKLHGAIDRLDATKDSYVVTEDSYIEYLVGGDLAEKLPLAMQERMKYSHFLFLGYALRDFNLRVVLHRIWGAQQLDFRSWAVQLEPTAPGEREVEEALWRDRGQVNLLYEPLNEFVAGLATQFARTAGTAA